MLSLKYCILHFYLLNLVTLVGISVMYRNSEAQDLDSSPTIRKQDKTNKQADCTRVTWYEKNCFSSDNGGLLGQLFSLSWAPEFNLGN